MATSIYRSIIKFNADRPDNLALARRVWDAVPWVANAYTGSLRNDRSRDMIMWCVNRYGPERLWSGDPPGAGAWQRGGAVVNGWTWWGFDTDAKMREFLTAWPPPDGVEPESQE